jgi:hypothetical protein
MLQNLGLPAYILAKTKLPYLDYVKLLRSNVYNWYDVALVQYGLKPHAMIRFKSGSKLNMSSKRNLLNTSFRAEIFKHLFISAAKNNNVKISRNLIEFEYSGKKVKFCYNKNASDAFSVLREVFIDNHYSFLDVKGKDVIDGGAYIGDTAVYFALNGANHVYAFEPDHTRYNLAKRNIIANSLNKKITLFHEGIGQSVSIGDLIEDYHLRDLVIKMDCEGCEYSTLLNATINELKRINQMQIEYHRGYKSLESKLKMAGFTVRHTIPVIEGNGSALGMLFAERKN